MDTTPASHMRRLWGLSPDMPAALDFPRLPPGAIHPMASRFAMPPAGGPQEAGALVPKLDEFQQAYRAKAASMLDGAAGLAPPGHPMYQRQASLAALRSENDRLSKENIDLKRQIGGHEEKEG